MTPFQPGDLVVDREQPHDEQGTAVVVQTLDAIASNHYIDALDTVVAAAPGNETYPPNDPVVEIIFEGHLDGHVPNWRAMLRDAEAAENLTFAQFLDDYRESWGVQLRSYTYPASRLAPRPYCANHSMRAERLDDAMLCPVESTFRILPRKDDALNADEEVPRPDDEWTREEVAEASLNGDRRESEA